MADLKALMADVLKLTPQAKLRVAIGLLDMDKPKHAEMLIDAALAQIQGDKLFGSETYARLTLEELKKL